MVAEKEQSSASGLNDLLVTEYTEVSENMRHFGNIRFAQMTLLFAITAGIIAGLFQASIQLTTVASTLLKLGGLVFTILFWAMDERAMQYWHHYRRRAIEIEEKLGYRQYTTAPAPSPFSATNAVRILNLLLALFWFAALALPSYF